ncbi:hypothetical protein LDG_7566 [Legionella drancourtii LLAP12]|uniref:Uncharacterized protein n=1 Tax=Legionella drancourtii LLAP12 TaxID=658187 RepID=G9EQL8_9GAMM|nr:hypothetical protein LDG_7566 [Legionella drancourtii LLAP12]
MLNHPIWASNKTAAENSNVDMAPGESSSDYPCLYKKVNLQLIALFHKA